MILTATFDSVDEGGGSYNNGNDSEYNYNDGDGNVVAIDSCGFVAMTVVMIVMVGGWR